MFDPTPSPKIFPFFGCLEMPQPSSYYEGSNQYAEDGRAEERILMSSSWNPQNSVSYCIYQFWNHPTSRLLDK